MTLSDKNHIGSSIPSFTGHQAQTTLAM